MELTVKGDAKEIAALVETLQGRQGRLIRVSGRTASVEDRKQLAEEIRRVLLDQIQDNRSEQSHDPKGPEQNQAEEPLLE